MAEYEDLSQYIEYVGPYFKPTGHYVHHSSRYHPCGAIKDYLKVYLHSSQDRDGSIWISLSSASSWLLIRIKPEPEIEKQQVKKVALLNPELGTFLIF